MFPQIQERSLSLVLKTTLEKATSRLSTLQIICSWLQILPIVRFIATPLIIPPLHYKNIYNWSGCGNSPETATLLIQQGPFPALVCYAACYSSKY